MLELRAIRVASIGIVLASVAACTAQDRYDAVYRENVMECDLKVSEAERERCREQLVPATYEEYERQRARALKRSRPAPRSKARVDSPAPADQNTPPSRMEQTP